MLIVVGVTAVLAGSLYAVNRVQTRKQAGHLKMLALKVEADGADDPRRRAEAINLFDRYLRLQPSDEDAASRLTQLLARQYQLSPSRETAGAFIAGAERILRQFPARSELRLELAEVYLHLRKVANAREHLEVVLRAPPSEPDQHARVLELLAVCDHLSGDLTTATDKLRQAIEIPHIPTEVRLRLYENLLRWLSENRSDPRREAKIAQCLRELREQDVFEGDARARVVAARFELARRNLFAARNDVNNALTLPGADRNPEVLATAAEIEVAQIQTAADIKPRLANARSYLEKAFSIAPHNAPVALALADVAGRQGDRTRALEVLRAGAEALGPDDNQYFLFIDRLIDLGSADAAEQLWQQGRDTPAGRLREGYFRGRLALLKDDWQTAEPLLREASQRLADVPEHAKRAWLGLARVAELQQNPDEQLRYCRLALQVPGPVLVSALIGEAEALAKTGRIDQAVVKYETLVAVHHVTSLRPTLVRLRLLDTLGRPPESRNWETFDSETTLGPADERTDEIQILYAQSLAARDRKAEAEKILEGIIRKSPPSPHATSAWVKLARIRHAGRPDAILAILDEATQSTGDAVDLRLARAEALVQRAKPPTPAEFLSLADKADAFPKPDRYRLWLGLAQAAHAAASRPTTPAARTEMTEAAITLARRAADAEPRDLLSRSFLIDLAIAAGKAEQVERILDELVPLEGPDGPVRSLARVQLGLPKVRKLEDKAQRAARIAELRSYAENARSRRNGWPRAYVALAMLDELEGFHQQALEHYRRAIALGERDEAVIRRTVELHRERKEDALAAGLLDELATRMSLPEDLERFRVIFSVLNQPLPKSELPTINRIAPADSRDYRLLLLRGSLLAAIREDALALEAFERAVALANPPAPEAYESLVGQLIRVGQTDRARSAVAEAEKNLLPLTTRSEKPAEVYLALGQLRELIGDLAAAEQHYRDAVAAARLELAPNRRLVEFLMRTGRAQEADELLLALTRSPAQDVVRWARRHLAAVSMMAKPDRYEKRHEALALIEKNLAERPDDPEDLKARAVIWTVDPQTREQGVRVLTDFWKQSRLTPDEAYLLGSLIFEQGPGKIAESVKYFEYAARPRPGVSLEHLAALVRVYLALDRLETAEIHLERLLLAAPRSWEALREEVRWLDRQRRDALVRGDDAEAIRLADRIRQRIRTWPGHDSSEAIRSRIGPLLEEIGFDAEAEQLYRLLANRSESPAAHLPLAALYLRRGRSVEAITLARRWENQAPTALTALILTQAVRAKRPGEALETEIATWLDRQIAAHAGKPDLHLLVESKAVLLEAQGRYDAAIAEYRKALGIGRTDSAVNNLALLLALRHPERAGEAVRMMDELIDLRGPAPAFLDTRALARMIQGGDALERAVADLHMALTQRYKPVYCYHLGQAYDLLGKRRESQKYLEEARKLGIRIDDVHPLERKRYLSLIGPDPPPQVVP